MRSSSCFRSLVLGFLLLFVLSCGESGTGGTNGLNVAGDDTSTAEKSIVTITVGGDGKTASMKVANNMTPQSSASKYSVAAGFSLRKDATIKVAATINRLLAAAGFMKEAVAAIPASVSTISFTISASNMTTITRDVTISGQTSITESFTVPNGNDRNFLVQAKNSSGTVIYKGDTTVTLSGTTATLNITMQANTTLGWSLLGTPLTITGKVTTVAGVAGSTGSAAGSRVLPRFNYPHGITSDGTNLYVADWNNHTIRKIVLSTGVVTLIGGYPGASGYTDGTDINARFYNPSDGVIVGTNLYVTDYSNHTIRKIDLTTNSVTTFAGTAGFYGSTDATGTSARFYNPWGITSDGTNLYVTEWSNHTIRKIEISTAIVTTLAGTALSYGSTDATGTSARFYNPAGITTDGTNIYVVDYGNYTIRKIVISSAAVTTLAGSAGLSGSTDGTGTAARFYIPYGITSDGTNLYVTTYTTIRKIVISTAVVTTLAGTYSSYGSTDGTGTAARFNNPYGITTDGTNLYVVDSNNHTIRKIVISTAAVTTFTGMAGSTGSNNDTFTSATFSTPIGITSDGTNLYIADRNNGAIRKIILSTGDVGTIATGFTFLSDITTDGTNLFVTEGYCVSCGYNQIKKIVISTGAVTTLAGLAGYSGSADGTGSAARFNYPYGITTDGTNLYVIDRANHTIRKVVISTGVVTTLAGTAGSSGSTDGTGTAARFNDPIRITTDGTNLYVSDYGNHTIRKIVISTGVVTTLAGTAGSSGTTDGTGSAARFNGPAGITTDSSYLYVTDNNNHTIRAVNLADNSVITVTGYPGSAGYFDWTGLSARFNYPVGIATNGTYLYVTENNNHTIRRIQ